jgi:endo-1,4-beta-D-glucanase Y
MNWEVPAKKGGSNAFDGDADIAYALLLAHAQWGGADRVDYAAAARSRLAGIMASNIGPQSRLPMLGDWVQADGAKMNQYTPRSSDFMPGHFRTWARFTGDVVWNSVAGNSASAISAIQTSHSPQTGLLPDFIVDAKTAPKPAPAKFLESEKDGAYNYNAGRIPWRLATDALLNGDATSAEQARKISAWAMNATQGDPRKLRSGYALDGTPLKGSDYFTTFFAAPIGVAAMLDAKNQAWLDALYESVRARHEDYFEDSIALQCLLVMTGNFWDPSATVKGNPPR